MTSNKFDNIVCQWVDIPSFMSGSRVHAKTDMCLISRSLGFICLVQEDKRYREKVNPEVQLVVEAIASFQDNNLQLSKLSEPVLNQKIVSGLTCWRLGVVLCHMTWTCGLVDHTLL